MFLFLTSLARRFPKRRNCFPFSSTRVEDPNLVTELEAHGIAFSGQVDNSWALNLLSWLMPLFVLILC